MCWNRVVCIPYVFVLQIINVKKLSVIMSSYCSNLQYRLVAFVSAILFACGLVSAQDVWIDIKTPQEWNTYAKSLSTASNRTKNYRLAADLDFTGVAFCPFGGVRYIGAGSDNESFAFQGVFDGNGHTISGISSFNSVGTPKPCIALFGRCKGATIKNLYVKNCTYPSNTTTTQAPAVGVVCGIMATSTVSNVIVENCSIVAGNPGGRGQTGIICGEITGSSTIENVVISKCSIGNGQDVGQFRGGVIGYTTVGCTIRNCYVHVNITSASESDGGIIGASKGNKEPVILENCFAAGAITANVSLSNDLANIGGIAGEANNIVVTNCASADSIIISSLNQNHQNMGGFFGKVLSGTSVEYGYALGNLVVQHDPVASRNGLNTFYGSPDRATDPSFVPSLTMCFSGRELYEAFHNKKYDESTVNGAIYGSPAKLVARDSMQSGCLAIDLNKAQSSLVWNQKDGLFFNYSVPFAKCPDLLSLLVKAKLMTQTDADNFSVVAPTCGSVQRVFHITSAQEMADAAKMVADNEDGWSADKTFIVDNDINGVTTVIGTTAKPFKGTFDGQSFTIGVNINSSADNVGVIGVADGSAVIKNVLVTGTVKGADNVGAVVGKSGSAVSVSGCASGAVVSGAANVGGVVGNAAGSISNCLNVANVTGSANVGGIAGCAGSLSDCANMGWIKGAVASTAGIVGKATGDVLRCLSAGYTEGAALANTTGVFTGSLYDKSIAVGGQTGATSFALATQATFGTLPSWTTADGSYPVPAGFAGTSIGKIAAYGVNFVKDNKANANADSIAVDPVWTSDNSSVLVYGTKAFNLVAEGSAIISVKEGGVVRSIPVVVKEPGLFSGGFGSPTSPFLITKYADLDYLISYVAENDGCAGQHFKVMNDITDGVLDFQIGTIAHPFRGAFYSESGKVYNIQVGIEGNSANPVGMFGCNEGLIERISVSGYIVQAKSGAIGAIVGQNGNGKIIDCVSSANLTSFGGDAAGICGIGGGLISKCVNVGKVKAARFAAGITIANESSALELSDCFNAGPVSGDKAAGVVAFSAGNELTKPIIAGCSNVGDVNASSEGDALIFANLAEPKVSGGAFDAQFAQLSSKSAIVTAYQTADMIAAGAYKAPGTSAVSVLASTPVSLHKVDSALVVKHDFTVSTANKVTWSSVNGCLKVTSDGKVSRVKAGADSLVATLNGHSRYVPVYVDCVWDSLVIEDPINVCNMFAGVVYDKTTTIKVRDSVLNDNPNADCGRVEVKTIIVTVGNFGETIPVSGCGVATYKGESFKKDTTFTDSDCNIVEVKVYPAAVKQDSVVTLASKDSTYKYVASSGKSYVVNRTDKPIVDSVAVIDTVKSAICKCDSLIRKVVVSIPSFVTNLTEVDVMCNDYEYTRFDGTKLQLGYPLKDRDENDMDIIPGVRHKVYRDTNFVAPNEFTEIRIVKVDIFKSTFTTDTVSMVGTSCNEVEYFTLSGETKFFEGERFLKDTLFYDSLPSIDVPGCAEEISLVKVRLKGISTTNDTVYVGSHQASLCATCSKEIILNEIVGDEYASAGYCDTIYYKRKATDNRFSAVTKDFVASVTLDETAETCGSKIPYKFRINLSDKVDSLIVECDSAFYTTRDGRNLVLKNDTVFSDVVKGAVPGCGCDSIYNIKVKVYKPKVITETIDNVCDEYSFEYLNPAKEAITVVHDTTIVDTVKGGYGCDSVIRICNLKINHSTPASEITPVVVEACQTYTYESPLKGSIVCVNDTTFSDSLKNVSGCDSIIPVKITIFKPVMKDTVLHVCGEYEFKYRDGSTVLIEVGDNPARLDSFLVKDVWKNSNPERCDTIVSWTIVSHGTQKIENKPVVVCSDYVHTMLDGTLVTIESSYSIHDTLKSVLCDCDSIIRIDSFRMGEKYMATDKTPLDTTLYGCRLTTTLQYVRRANAWNEPRTISYVPVSSEYDNQAGFLQIVQRSNPTVVKLDTVVSHVNGINRYNYYWLCYDTMKTVSGCDSIIPFRVEYDGQHTLGRRIYYVNHKQVPFYLDGVAYNFNGSPSVQVKDSIEVILPSTTGGCDSTYFATVRLYPCKIDQETIHACDMISFLNLHGSKVTFTSDTVYSDTLRYVVAASDTAVCDSVIKTWTITVGKNTPAELISKVYLGGCDSVSFHRSTNAVNMVAADTMIYTNTSFNCIFVNASGCDSVVPVVTTVHPVNRKNARVVRATDFYRYVSPFDGHVERIYRDTTISEVVPNYVEISKGNGETFFCDSVFNTIVTINPAAWTDTTITGCDSVFAVSATDSIRGNIDDMTKAWYYEDADFDLPNTNHAAPYYHVHIRLNETVRKDIKIESCGEVVHNGKTFISDTTFSERNTAASGCDSIVTFHIVIYPVIEDTLTIKGCGALIHNGVTYYRDEQLINVYPYHNGCGCDSFVKVTNIIINEPVKTNILLDSCLSITHKELKSVGYNIFLHDSVYLASGKPVVYEDTTFSYFTYLGMDKNGCDTIANVTVEARNCFPTPVVVNKYNWMLVLDQDHLFVDKLTPEKLTGYQWYAKKNIEDEFMLVPGAKLSFYTNDKQLTGCYQAHVFFGRKEFYSEEICIDNIQAEGITLSVYPNPAELEAPVYFKLNETSVDALVEVFNAAGSKVYSIRKNIYANEENELPIAAVAGSYILRVTTKNGVSLESKYVVK